jgi:hypothetical protein
MPQDYGYPEARPYYTQGCDDFDVLCRVRTWCGYGLASTASERAQLPDHPHQIEVGTDLSDRFGASDPPPNPVRDHPALRLYREVATEPVYLFLARRLLVTVIRGKGGGRGQHPPVSSHSHADD